MSHRHLHVESPQQIAREYEGAAERPLTGYVAALAGYATEVGLLAGVAALKGRTLPARIGAGDIALLAVATHKLSRLVGKDAVLSPLRAPFTRYQEPAGDGEVNEAVRGTGVRHAIGELLSCPFCLAMWISTALCGGLVLVPRLTRLVEVIMTAVTASDLLQLGYDAAKQLPARAAGRDG